MLGQTLNLKVSAGQILLNSHIIHEGERYLVDVPNADLTNSNGLGHVPVGLQRRGDARFELFPTAPFEVVGILIGTKHMNAEHIRANSDDPVAFLGNKLNLGQSFSNLQVGAFAVLNAQPHPCCSLFSGFSGILIAELDLKLARDRKIPLRFRDEPELAKRLFYRRIPISPTLIHCPGP